MTFQNACEERRLERVASLSLRCAHIDFRHPLLAGRQPETYPEIEVQLSLQDKPFNLIEHGLDAVVRFGDIPDSRHAARVLANNHRILCATPGYLKAMGTPHSPTELGNHRCLFIREGDEAYGTWHLEMGERRETVKVRGPLSSNDGEAVLHWAMDGHGILMRSLWDVAPMLREGKIVEVLADWTLPRADIHICFPTGSPLSAKTRALVDFLLEVFSSHRKRQDGVVVADQKVFVRAKHLTSRLEERSLRVAGPRTSLGTSSKQFLAYYGLRPKTGRPVTDQRQQLALRADSQVLKRAVAVREGGGVRDPV